MVNRKFVRLPEVSISIEWLGYINLLCTYQCHYQNPNPRGKKELSKLTETNGLPLFSFIKLKDQMHDVRSKSPPWGYTLQSNSRGLSNPPPPPLGLDIDKYIRLFIHLSVFVSGAFCLVGPFQSCFDHSQNAFIDTIFDLRPVASPNESRRGLMRNHSHENELNLQVSYISIRVHQASLWQRSFNKFWNGLFSRILSGCTRWHFYW